MAVKIFKPIVIAILLLLAVMLASAETPAAAAGATVVTPPTAATGAPASATTPTASGSGLIDQAQGDGSSVGYYFDTDANGNSVFTQVLSWDEDPYALRFDVSIRDSAGTEIFHKTTESTSVKVQLVPDKYTYNIVTWNLLDQPEEESGWQPLIVIKAEIPKITGVSPAFIYMDMPSSKIIVKGEKLVQGASVLLRDVTGHDIKATESVNTGDSEVSATFPEKDYKPGLFDLVVVNPGGLQSTEKKAVRIQFQRPVDILVGAGYSPITFFQDSWFKANWNKPMYWLGANANLSVYFVKKGWGFLGAEAFAEGFKLTGGIELAAISSEYLLTGGNFLYRYRFSKAISAVAHVGGGVAQSKHSFDYHGMAGPKLSASNLCLDGGLSAQYFFPFKMYVELGASWYEIFGTGYTAGGLSPTLRVGYQIF